MTCTCPSQKAYYNTDPSPDDDWMDCPVHNPHIHLPPKQCEFSKVVAFPLLTDRGTTFLEEAQEPNTGCLVILVTPTKLTRMLRALQKWSADHDFAIFLNRDVLRVMRLLHNVQGLTLSGIRLTESPALPAWACSVASSSGDAMLFDLRTDKEVGRD